MNKLYEILVISGGGIKTASILGSLQYYYDNNIINNNIINTIIGTSIGSIISLFLGANVQPKIILSMYQNLNVLFDLITNLNITNIIYNNGAFSLDKMKYLIEEYMIKFNIQNDITLLEYYERYNKNLIFCSYNITNRRCEYISKENNPNLKCIDAACMSSCIPILFSPIKYNSDLYIDGGIYDNFPIKYAEINFKHKHIIGFDIENTTNTHDTTYNYNLLEYIYILFNVIGDSKKNIHEHGDNIKIVSSKIIDNISINFIIPYKCKINMIDYTNLFIFNYNLHKDKKLKLD
jgi:NTE family protein